MMHDQAARTAWRSFSIRRTIEAPPAEVFAAWLDPTALSRWFRPGRGWRVPISKISIDVRPGGRWQVTMVDPTRVERTLVFVYREITPPERLVFTTVMDGPLATVSLLERNGSTELTFQAAADEADVAEVATAWSNRLDQLASHIRN